MTALEWLEIGRIVAPQGLRGEVRVYPNTDFPERFLVPGTRWLRRKGEREPQPVELLGGRDIPGKGLYVVALDGIETREAAEALRDAVFLVTSDDRPELEEDEYHVMDLIALEVFDRSTGERLGIVTDVLSAGNDLLEVQLDRPSISVNSPTQRYPSKRQKPPKPPTVLIPFVKAIVPVVDLAAKRLEITPPPGLLDL
ncbi:MAG: ribosome maturation factor RimM [Cyanobacteria bacterium SID2]|nr:ribosome maturation factor RimM [Cyanobacteria bacterium SID2]MBP0003281.1 ribosome maturation factor RimM [Cyanobacteria bacterium SBC]